MLKSLEIKDYALIDHINVEFGKGLNIITGETGAGKSILIDAILHLNIFIGGMSHFLRLVFSITLPC